MTRSLSLTAVGVCLLVACGGDDEVVDADARPADAAPMADAPPNTPDAGPTPSVARGKYLVDHVAACTACHTPRNMDGSPNMDQYLAGVDCFVDTDPMDMNAGCLSSRNLTNHPTGLMNRTDAEIKAMFQNGMRPNGDALFPIMPYYIFHNMTDVDADSIVMYLRTVTGVDKTVAPNTAPFDMRPPMPAPAFPEAMIPMPATPTAEKLNGRYLAAMAGVCMECHTPRDMTMALDTTKLFAGGEPFPAAAFGLPVPPFPDVIFTANITPHPTSGIGGHSVQDLVTIIKMGTDKNGDGVCPPMPSGPMGEFGGMTDDDAADIAAYLLDIPAIDNTPPNGCAITGP